MLRESLWYASFAILFCVLLAEMFPGHRSAAAREEASAAAQCREMERMLAERRDTIDPRLVLVCRPPL